MVEDGKVEEQLMSLPEIECPNCGQSTTGDHCEWCGHPVTRRSRGKKSLLAVALGLALVLTGGIYAYTWTTSMTTIGIAEPTGDFATVSCNATPQPDWDSVLPTPYIEILRPEAPGDETNIPEQYPASEAHWDKVADETPDDLSTVIYDYWTPTRDLYNISDHSEGSGNVNSVTVYFHVSTNSDAYVGYAKAVIKTHNTVYEGSDEAQTGSTFVTKSYQWTDNPYTNSAWTWEEIDALQGGVSLRSGSLSDAVYCTQIYVAVDYAIICGDVPTGRLCTVTPDPYYTGDLLVKVYLTNTGSLIKAYHYLNMKLYLQNSDEAQQSPNYQLLTLQNGEAAFTLQNLGGLVDYPWTQTSRADFDEGTLSQLESTSSPGNVKLGTISDTVTDSYNNTSKIASSANVTVTGGQVKLTTAHGAATETLRPNAAGDTTNIAYQFPDSGAHWDKVDDVVSDNFTTYVYTNYTSYRQDLFNLANTSVGSGPINSVRIYYRYAAKVGENYGGIYAIGYEENDNDVGLKTLRVYNYGVLAAPIIDYVKLDASTSNVEPIILRIRDNVIVIAYNGATGQGMMKTVYITGEGQVTDVTDTLQFDTTGLAPDIIHVSGNIYAVAYTGANSRGYLKTVEISQDGLIADAVIDSLQIATVCDDADLVHVSGNIFAIAYQGAQADGYVATVEITPDGQISNSVIDSYEYCTSDADRPDIAHMSGNIFAIAYSGQGGPGYVKTVEIATNGQITEPVIDTLNFDAVSGGHPSMLAISDTVAVITYEGQASDGRLCTVGIDANGQIQNTVIDYIRHETVNGADPSILHIYGNIFVVAYQGQSGIGRVRSFEISTDGYITSTAVDTVEFESIFAANPHIMVADIVGTLLARMYVEPIIKTHGVTYTGTEYSDQTSTFTTQSEQWTTNPYTGQAWTWSEVNALQAGIELRVDDDDIYATCTQVYVVVDYNPAYNFTGALASTNLLSGETVCSITSFGYYASAISPGATLQAQFSSDNTSWYNSGGTLGGWDTISQGTGTINISTFEWSGANFYYKMRFTSDGINGPVLDDITVTYGIGYYASGMLTSPPHYTKTNTNVSYGNINFTISEPGSTDIKFQLRSAPTEEELGSATWYGPTGTDDYYTTSGTAINSIHDGDRWIQYKAYFSSSGNCNTPTLSDVTIDYMGQYYTFELIGGSYCLVSADNNTWSEDWTVTPEFYIEVTQR